MPQPRPLAAALVLAGAVLLAAFHASATSDVSPETRGNVSGGSDGDDNGSSNGTGTAVKDVAPLTSADIEAFMASIPDVRNWAKRQDDATRTMTERRFDADTMATEPFEVGLQRIEGSPAYDELAGTIRAHGFMEPGQWAVTADRIIRALAALQREESGPTPDQLDQTRRQVLNNPNLSAAEKEEILSSVGMATAMRTAPEKDLEAITPYAEQLAQALSQEE